jgi:hypothetical protein
MFTKDIGNYTITIEKRHNFPGENGSPIFSIFGWAKSCDYLKEEDVYFLYRCKAITTKNYNFMLSYGERIKSEKDISFEWYGKHYCL